MPSLSFSLPQYFNKNFHAASPSRPLPLPVAMEVLYEYNVKLIYFLFPQLELIRLSFL